MTRREKNREREVTQRRNGADSPYKHSRERESWNPRGGQELRRRLTSSERSRRDKSTGRLDKIGS